MSLVLQNFSLIKGMVGSLGFCMTHNYHGFTFERSSATLCPKRQGPPIVALVAPSSVAPAAVIRGHL